MALLRAQVRLKYYTNLPEDVSTNTLHFVTDDSNLPAVDAISLSQQINFFYGDMGTPGSNGPFSPVLASSGHKIVWWNLDDPEPRVPIYETDLTTLPRNNTSTGLPEECAAVLSFQADPQSGVNQARRRGRIYLGPLSTVVLSPGSSSGFSAIGTVFRTAVIDSAVENLLDLNTIPAQWVVNSTLTLPSIITNGWMDVTFDTQRRRGGRVTGRTVWP